MGAVSGQEFINRLNSLENEIWYDGQKIVGPVSEHPAFKGLIQSKAALYDLQLNPELLDKMTFISPSQGIESVYPFYNQKRKRTY